MSTKTRKRGRPPKLTDDVRKSILASIAAGVPRKHAAERAGVHVATFHRWVAEGRRQRAGEFRDFCDALKKAEADAVARNVALVQRAAQGGQVVERTTVTTTNARTGVTTTRTTEKTARGEWTAAAWWLERRHGDEFAGNRREVKELREQLARLVKVFEHGGIVAADRPGEAHPPVGGDGRPDAI